MLSKIQMTAITIFQQITIKITFQQTDRSKPIINEENMSVLNLDQWICLLQYHANGFRFETWTSSKSMKKILRMLSYPTHLHISNNVFTPANRIQKVNNLESLK